MKTFPPMHSFVIIGDNYGIFLFAEIEALFYVEWMNYDAIFENRPLGTEISILGVV